MEPPESYHVVYRILLTACIDGLDGGSRVLRGSIISDDGLDPKSSASSLAQDATRVLQHVGKIRYTKEFYNSKITEQMQPLCHRYVKLENLFNDKIVKRLIDIATVRKDPDEPQKSTGKLANLIEWILGSDADQALQEADQVTSGRISEIAPDLQATLEEIIQEAHLLREQIEAHAPRAHP
jgi:hypothetical protein